MKSPANDAWGPRPMFAVLPVVALLVFSGWVWSANRGPLPTVPVAVVALKPVDDTTPRADLPIEVRYGVPTEPTLPLWVPAG